jgi:hypothetical protein
MIAIPESCRIAPNLARGSTGPAVRTLQMWLVHHGQNIAVDGDFGPVTEAGLKAVSDRTVTDEWANWVLTAPMLRALSVEGSIQSIARAHLREHPHECGGTNHGVWPRLYGGDAAEARGDAWCMHFARFIAKQAGLSVDVLSPSCDVTHARAATAGRILTAPEPGCAFLLWRPRGTGRDYYHGGIVLDVGDGAVSTAEGNTAGDGRRDGWAALERRRAVGGSIEFVRLGP